MRLKDTNEVSEIEKLTFDTMKKPPESKAGSRLKQEGGFFFNVDKIIKDATKERLNLAHGNIELVE